MASVQELINWVKQKLSNKFLRNVGWLSLSELFIRLSRLVTTVILARLLNEYDYGLAALVLTTNEFITVFTRNGIFDKLIQAEEENLAVFCQTAYSLNWMICIGLFLTQCLLAYPVSIIYKDQSLFTPICTMALIYLVLPFGLVQAARSQRENRLHISALANGLQVCTDNLLTMVLAFWGWGMWAIVLPKVLVAPIWAGVHRMHNPWRPETRFILTRWREIAGFGQNILGIQMLNTLRNNIDYLIAGRFFGIEALGVYYFAFNAGLGISLSAITALDSALYPHLCEVRLKPKQFLERLQEGFFTISKVIFPLVIFQTMLAPIYVPLIFGQKWISATPILILICLSAIPRPFANAASKALWAIDKPQWDLRWNIIFTILFTLSVLIGAWGNVIGVATAVLIIHGIALPGFILWVLHYLRKDMIPHCKET